MAKIYDDDEEISFGGKDYDGEDDGLYDDDIPESPGVSIHVNLNINISSVEELEKVEPIIDRLAAKYGYTWE